MHVASTTSWTVLFFFNFQLFDLMARLTGKKIVNFLTVDWKKDLIVGGISQRQMSQASEAVGLIGGLVSHVNQASALLVQKI